MKNILGAASCINSLIITLFAGVRYVSDSITVKFGMVLIVLQSSFSLNRFLHLSSLSKQFGIITYPSRYAGLHKVIPFLFLSLLSNAQVNVEWSNEPGGVAVATDQLHQVYTANWDFNPGGDITLTKRTSDGNILWNAAYDNTDNTRHEVATWIETDGQNNCIVAGTIRSGISNPVNAASLLMKFDGDGNLLWRNIFEGPFEGTYTKKILLDNADNIYVLGTGIGANGQVVRIKKFNSEGVSQWTFYDTDGIGGIPVNIKLTPDNSLLVSARGITGIINGYIKLSLDGNQIWSKSGITSPTTGDAAGDSFGNTYIVNGENVSNGGSILEKFDPNGNLIWSDTNAMAASKVEIGSDNNPLISGFPNSGSGGAAFMKYDSNGAILWQNLDADGPELLLLHGQLKLDAANNAYLSAGNLFNMAVCKINSDGSNGWVGLVSGSSTASSFSIDADYSVYLIGGTTAKLSQSILSTHSFNRGKFSIAPNPFEDYISISMQQGVGEKRIHLYSIDGKIVYEGTLFGHIENITLLHLEKGLYILTITDQNGVLYTQKVIKN